MKVGIDACLLAEQMTGIGRYTAEIARELSRMPGEYCLYTPKPPLLDDWSKERVQFRAGKLRGRVGKILWSQTQLPYWAARDRVDVFWGATHRLPRLLPARMARVVTIHDLVWKFAGDTMPRLNRLMEQVQMPMAVAMADRIAADSHSTAEAIEAEFPAARGKIKVIYPGVTDLCRPASRESLQRFGIERPYFLFVGTLEPRKNLSRLLAAYASLDPTLRNRTELVIAGGKGWGGVDTAAEIARFGLIGQVRLTDYVSEQDLATLYAHARFLAMPSLYEGFGLPLVEAMSFGVPVLTSNTSSLPEVAGDGGLLVDPLDESSIAAGLVQLIVDEQVHTALAERARAAAARFSWVSAAKQMHELFADAIQVRRERR